MVSLDTRGCQNCFLLNPSCTTRLQEASLGLINLIRRKNAMIATNLN